MPKIVALVKVRQAKNLNLRRRFVFTVAHNVRLLSAAAVLAILPLIYVPKINKLLCCFILPLQSLLWKADVASEIYYLIIPMLPLTVGKLFIAMLSKS